jgi:phage terminase Nu1 subunit (DNA packaging protein)
MDNSVPLGTIAKLLKLSERRVNQLNKMGVIPKNGRGRYDIVPAVHGYLDFIKEKAPTTYQSDKHIDYHTEKARLIRSQADQAEIELLKTKQNIITVDDMKRLLQDVVLSTKSRLLNVPNRVAPMVVSEDDEGYIKEIMIAEINEALNELARKFAEYEPSDNDDNDEEQEEPAGFDESEDY